MGVGKQLADQLNKRLQQSLPGLSDELKAIARRPRSLGAWLETQSPWLNRRFLGAASNVAEPFVAGMGLRIDKLAEEICEVAMPGSIRNRGAGGVIHSGALTVLGELAGRLYLEHHLDLRDTEIDVRRVQVRVVLRPTGDLKGVFRMSVAEREAVLHKLRGSGISELESQTLLYDADGRLVAEVEVDWEVRRQLALGSGSGSGDIE